MNPQFTKHILTPLNRLLQRFLGLLSEDRGLLYINFCLRMAALVVLAGYFFEHAREYDATTLTTVQVMLVVFFLYNLASGWLGRSNEALFLTKPVKLAQSVFEIMLLSVFYFLTHDPRSDIFFVYFIPLYSAVHFLDFFSAVGVILFAIANLFCVLNLLESAPLQAGLVQFNSATLVSIFWLRAVIMFGMALVYAIRRRASLVQELAIDQSHISALFRSMEDGLFIIDRSGSLLFVNESLRSLHGDQFYGRDYQDYFHCRSYSFHWEAGSASISQGSRVVDDEIMLADRNGTPYSASVRLVPLPGHHQDYDSAIGIVRDLRERKKLVYDLESVNKTHARQISELISQRMQLSSASIDLAKLLSGLADMDALMDLVVRETLIRLNAETASIFLVENGVLVRKAIAGLEPSWLADEHYLPGQGITGQVIISPAESKYGQPVISNDVTNDSTVVNTYLQEYSRKLDTQKVRHLVAVPLNGGKSSFGVLRVVNKLEERGRLDQHGFSLADQELLVSIASMAAIALENSRLLQETHQRYQQARALYTIGQHITRAANWRELGRIIANETVVILGGASKAAIYLINPQSGELEIQTTSEANPTSSGLPPLRCSEGIAGRAISSGSVIYVPDVRSSPDYVDRGVAELRSIMVAPLMADKKALGILSVDSQKLSAFTEEDQQLLGLLASQAAVVVEKEQLYQQEIRRRKQADTLLDVSLKLNSSQEIEKTLPEILADLKSVVEFSSISIQVLDRKQRLRIISSRGFDNEKVLSTFSFPTNDHKFPNYEVVKTHKPYIVNDVLERYPHFHNESKKYQSGHIRSWMGVPLLHHSQMLGMISVDHSQPGQFNEEIATLLMTFANQIAIALANSRLFAEKQQQVVQLDKLFQAAHTITSSLKLEEVLEKITNLANEVSGADHSGVILLDKDGDFSNSVETNQVDRPLFQRVRQDGVTARVIRTRRPVIHNQVLPTDKYHNPVIAEMGFKSYVGLPIIKGNSVLGVLFAHSLSPGRFNRQQEIPLLQALCNLAAIAVENALLYDEAERQAVMLSKMVETSSSLIRHTEQTELLKYCAQKAAEMFEVEDCSLYLIDERTRDIKIGYSSRIPPEIWTQRRIALDGPGLTAYVARTGSELNFGGGEYRDHKAWSGHTTDPFLDHLRYLPSGECQSLFLCALKNHLGENIGVLKLENRLDPGRGKRFPDFEVAIQSTFASHVGMAVERAWLYQKLNQKALQEARAALSNDLHDISNLIHGAVVLRLAIAKEQLDRDNLADLKRELEKVSKAAQTVHSWLRWIHNDLRGNDILQEKGLIAALDHVAGLLNIAVLSNESGGLVFPVEVEYALYKIGLEALANAAKHGGKNIQVWVNLDKISADDFALEIIDNGSGFDKVKVLQRPYKFGLEGMNRWAESIGARIDFDSRPDQGTKIKVVGKINEKGVQYG